MAIHNGFKASAVAALVVAHCAGMLDLVALPVWVGALVERFGFQPQQAGALATLFLVGGVLASSTVAPRFIRLNHKAVATGGFLLAALAFGIAASTRDFAALAGLHLFAGVASGCGLSLVHGSMGRSPNPHRIFAFASIAIGLFGIVMLAGLPQLLIARGGPALFEVFSLVLALAAVICLLWFPKMPTQASGGAPVGRFGAPIWYVIGGVSALTLNQAMVFSFVEVIGKARAFPPQAVLGVLAALGIVNFVVAGPLAMVLQKRVRAETMVLAGPAIQGVFALVVTNVTYFPLWAPVSAVFVAVMIVTHTFAFGLLARLDPSSRAVALTPAMLMVGAALGPVLGGVLGQRFGFGALGLFAVVVAMVAITLFYRGTRFSLSQSSRSLA